MCFFWRFDYIWQSIMTHWALSNEARNNNPSEISKHPISIWMIFFPRNKRETNVNLVIESHNIIAFDADFAGGVTLKFFEQKNILNHWTATSSASMELEFRRERKKSKCDIQFLLNHINSFLHICWLRVKVKFDSLLHHASSRVVRWERESERNMIRTYKNSQQNYKDWAKKPTE